MPYRRLLYELVAANRCGMSFELIRHIFPPAIEVCLFIRFGHGVADCVYSSSGQVEFIRYSARGPAVQDTENDLSPAV